VACTVSPVASQRLITDNERNLPLYLRHGFVVASAFFPHDGKGPRTRAMLGRMRGIHGGDGREQRFAAGFRPS
jgi:hypothetical protein